MINFRQGAESMKYYNERLKDFRKYLDLPQRKMAEALGISQQHYSMYESGKRVMSAEQIIIICKKFNVSADYILALTDEFKNLN